MKVNVKVQYLMDGSVPEYWTGNRDNMFFHPHMLQLDTYGTVSVDLTGEPPLKESVFIPLTAIKSVTVQAD